MNFDEKFDMIVSRTTFHHLNIERVLNKCVSLLNDGGTIYIKDVVSKTPTPARWTYIVVALLEFPSDCVSFGFKNALRIFSHNTSKEWLSHLSSDVYLSESDYHRIYGKCLPNCKYINDGWAMSVIWKKQI